MAKRINPSDRAIDYFIDAPIEEASTTFNAIKRIMFKRLYQAPAQPKLAPKPRKKRTPKAAEQAQAAVQGE